MTSLTLLASAILALASATVYAFVGRLMLQRPFEDAHARFAMRMFAAWWLGLSTLNVINGAREFMGATGLVSVPIHASLILTSMLPLSIALFGLLYYLLFIYLGRPSIGIPLAIWQSTLFVGLTYLILALQPDAVIVGKWSTTVSYAQAANPAVAGVFVATLLGPVIFAAIAFATLYFRADEPTTRYRIAMVAAAFIGWFGVSLIASFAGWNSSETWPLASRIIALTATGVILAAYRPPRFIQKRLNVRSVTSELANETDAEPIRANQMTSRV